MTGQPPFSGPDLCRMEAHQVVALLKRGEVSPAELIDAALARIKAVEPAVNAVPTLCAERARKAAARLDGKNADHPGWLAGLPIGIKDLTDVAGVRTTYGTLGRADHVPERSDPLVERLESRGAVVLGKTNTPELGAGANTFNAVFGRTRNPWDTRLNAAGSSGGAAVSLATGELWLSHGSDHGGSLRTPAAFNGVVGLRPSPGRAASGCETAGFMIESVQGPMARSVTDCALFLDAMSGFEPTSPISFPAPDTPFLQAVRRADPKVRIAFSPDLSGLSPVEPEIADALSAAMTAVAAAGGTVERVDPHIPELLPTYFTLRGIAFAVNARALPPEVQAHLKATIRQNMEQGLSMTMEQVADAQIARTALFRRISALVEDFDVLAFPTVGNLPRPVEQEWVDQINGVPLPGYMDWLRYTFLATVTGLPAISVPVGLSAGGLPIGIQLLGPPRGEARLLAVARAVEMAVGGPLGPIDPVVRHDPAGPPAA